MPLKKLKVCNKDKQFFQHSEIRFFDLPSNDKKRLILIGLTREKSKLEVEYEKLLTINETLANDLELAIRQKKNIKEEQVNLMLIVQYFFKYPAFKAKF